MVTDNIESIRQGLDMIIAPFVRTLGEIGVKKLAAVGEQLDPELHEAVTHEHSETVAEGVVIKAWNAGYKFGEKTAPPRQLLLHKREILKLSQWLGSKGGRSFP
jgi:molecular chaperone GrpE